MMKLKEQMQRHTKLQGKSPKTFETYWHWCSEFFEFCRDKAGTWVHPKECGRKEIESWLTYLANERHVSKNTQNLALQSVLYLYREILEIKIEGVKAMRSTKTVTVRDVLDVSELRRLFDHMDGVPLLAAQMMYGCGLRIGDLIALRIKDISFERKQIAVKTAKGDKWRYVSFPEVLHDAVKRQIESTRVLHRHDEQDNPNGVSLPGAYRRKSPSSARSIMWYWLFPSDTLSKGDEGVFCRHHRDTSHIARQIKEASQRAGIEKRVTSHILRHCYATHSHENGVSLRTLMLLLGHNDIRTTEIYTHADKNAATSAKSPLETLLANPGHRQHKPKDDDKPFTLRVVG
jgi:integron integrase